MAIWTTVLWAAAALAPEAGREKTDDKEPVPVMVPDSRGPTPRPWQQGDGPRTPIPKRFLRDWITSDDFPYDEIRAGTEGYTRFELAVDATGRVTGCRVTMSSDSAILDKETCRLLTLRSEFSPALDASGRPVAGVYAEGFRWIPPRLRKNSFADGSLTVEFTLGADGVPRDCRADIVGNPFAMGGGKPCETLQRTEPFLDAEGKAVERRVRMEVKIAVEDD